MLNLKKIVDNNCNSESEDIRRLFKFPDSSAMQIFNNFSIAKKIGFGYSLAIGMGVIGTSIGLGAGDYYQKQAQEERSIAQDQYRLFIELENAVIKARLHQQRLVGVLGNYISFELESKRFLTGVKRIEKLLVEIEDFIETNQDNLVVDDEELKTLLQSYATNTKAYRELIELLRAELDASTLKLAEIPAAREQVLTAILGAEAAEINVNYDGLLESLFLIRNAAERQEDIAVTKLEEAEKLRWQIIATSMAMSVLMSVLLAVITSRAIARPIQEVSAVVRKVTERANVQVIAPVITKDEVAVLRSSMEHMVQWIEDYTKELREGKEAAEIANKAKSEFMANMSHELRTPLSGVLGYAQILERDKEATPAQLEGIKIIYQSGSHLLMLINDLLDIYKIEANKLELCPTDFNFPDFLKGVVEICRIRAEQKGIDFIYRPLTKLPMGVNADEKRLRQVLINLLGNAIKFTEKGAVKFKVASLGFEGENGKVNGRKNGTGFREKIRFQIEDTGVGMTPEEILKIFLPFEQVGEGSKQAEGTGLGLAISRRLVEMMGSEIQVDSQVGKGSLFWIDINLPISSGWVSLPGKVEANIISYKGKRRRVLVVDDCGENRGLIVNLLNTLGFQTSEASNGKEGLEKAETIRPDSIVTDIVMPEMDGYEMTERLRQLPGFEEVKIIASSASVSASQRRKSLQFGCNDFIPKPVLVAELLEKLQIYLDLEWVYDVSEESTNKDEQITVNKEEIVAPPAKELMVLYEAARIGDFSEIEAEALRIKLLDKKYEPLVNKVLNLAEEFEDAAIINLLKQYISELAMSNGC
ncbi:MAG: ATP-binding protein [Cyanobacteriota bacterium]|nr:ATP-binding protein [Cyanobacteriota bacterium]